jgi:hypothetical protein
MRTQWKTGRQYTNRGQRIIAEEITPGTLIVFRDLDRGIDGIFGPEIIGKFRAGNELALQAFVVENYDQGAYAAPSYETVTVFSHLEWREPAADLTDECIRRGEMIVELLGLRPLRGYEDPRYDTSAGTKTSLGLYNTIKRIIEEGK